MRIFCAEFHADIEVGKSLFNTRKRSIMKSKRGDTTQVFVPPPAYKNRIVFVKLFSYRFQEFYDALFLFFEF